MDLVEGPSGGAAEPSGAPARPDSAGSYVAPRDGIESNLARWLEELLAIDQVGVHDSFFALGGHSLTAIAFFSRVVGEYQVEFTFATLFEAPTVAEIAKLLREGYGGATADDAQGAEPARLRSLVAIQPAGSRPPIFCMHGKGGQVIELRQLAIALGPDQPFYGLQARGITGSEPPHQTIEEMAEHYLAEIRAVQPRGPYVLAGYSGGGVTAYEMAQRLRSTGDAASVVIFIDTLQPAINSDAPFRRLIRFVEASRAQGLGYLTKRLTEEARNRVHQLTRRPAADASDYFADTLGYVDLSEHFIRITAEYQAQQYDGEVVLVRAPTRAYSRDLGWQDVVPNLQVSIVGGDHLSMMEEPNVSVLAARIRDSAEEAGRRGPVALAR